MPTKKTTPSKKKKEKISSFQQRVTLAFLALSLLLVFLIIYFSLAQVKIYITPQSSTIKTTFKVEILTDTQEILAGTNIMPGAITTFVDKQEKTFAIPEGGTVEGTARGKVTIINNYSKNQPLIKTTRLLTPDGKLFRLDKTVTVPAGGSIEVEVYADQPGPEYDIDPTKFTIPGLWEGLQDKIYAESNEKFTGGLRQEKVATAELIEKTAESFIKEARELAKSQIKPTQEENFITFAMGGSTWSSDVEAGQTAEKLTITVETPITTIEFKKENLQNIALNNLIAQTPARQQFISADFPTLKFELVDINEKQNSATLAVSLEGKSATRLNKNNLDITKLQGKNKQELISYLTSLPEIADIKVIFTPAWMGKVPPMRDHIYIEIVK